MTRRYDDFRRRRDPPPGVLDWLLAGLAAMLGAAAIGATVLIVLGLPRPAHARWTGTSSDPVVASWFKNQHNADGQWCCDESDGHPYYGEWTINEDGGVTVELDGKPHVLPKGMVLTGPNPTGHAIWWFTETSGGHRDYCFAPGTLS